MKTIAESNVPKLISALKIPAEKAKELYRKYKNASFAVAVAKKLGVENPSVERAIVSMFSTHPKELERAADEALAKNDASILVTATLGIDKPDHVVTEVPGVGVWVVLQDNEKFPDERELAKKRRQDEGEKMGHCIGKDEHDFAKAWSLRKIGSSRPLATAASSPGPANRPRTIDELNGPMNSEPTPELIKAAQALSQAVGHPLDPWIVR